MDEKLKKIFTFLIENREYNKTLQEKYYLSVIIPYTDIKEKVISLLYNIANTQSQPRIDKLASFYQTIYEDINCLNSFEGFIKIIHPDNPIKNYKSLFDGMKNQKGWGNKTAALFTKSIFHLHNGNYSGKLKIWDDVPSKISEEDFFYLPVDSVIIAIFNKLDNTKKWNFNKVNNIIKKKYSAQQIEIWDDLWFWGFITQKGSGADRQFIWNKEKYWALKDSDKNSEKINIIKKKAEFFLRLLE